MFVTKITNMKKPVKLKLEAGKNYAWCTCGLSDKLPFCDGKHSDTGMRPLIFSVDETKEYYLCACQHTQKPPFCDGSHKH